MLSLHSVVLSLAFMGFKDTIVWHCWYGYGHSCGGLMLCVDFVIYLKADITFKKSL